MSQIQMKEKQIRQWNNAYYANNESLVSDKIYDDTVAEVLAWYKEHPEIENYGPTAEVGSSLPNSKLPKIKHNKRMLSLANTYSVDEVRDMIKKLNLGNDDWIAEQKLDGLSLALWYENGKLTKAITRGDGEYGEDVTESARFVAGIPEYIAELANVPFMEIRGEVLIPKTKFREINKLRDEAGLPTFATSRNLASGTLRQLDTSIVSERGLSFVAYYVVDSLKLSDVMCEIGLLRAKANNIPEADVCTNSGEYQNQVLDFLELDLGFEVPSAFFQSGDEGKAIRNLEPSDSDEYDVDGIVFKINDISRWTEETAKTPKWAFAYKYPTEQVETKLIGVTWQVGRTGKITPVAELEPVTISGTVVSRATLHNMDEITKKDIRIRDYVIVEKAAEIIPQVVCPVVDKRSIDAYPITPPTKCPICGGNVTKRDASFYYCVGSNCAARVVETISYFADRSNMNIMGLGRSTVEKLVEAGLLTDIASIYELKNHRDELIQLDKLSEKSVDKLLAEIEDSRNRDFGVLLGSLGIPRIGRTNGRRLGNTYHGWKALLTDGVKTGFKLAFNCGLETFTGAINWFIDIGDSNLLTGKYAEWLKDPNENGIMDFATPQFKRILEVGLGKYEYNEVKEAKLHKLNFCFTGKVPITRNELEESITKNGGEFSSSVTKNCTHLIAGLNPTKHKIETATKYGIKIISYDEYLKMI